MKRQRGAALLAAMVTVTLIATLAATALSRQTQLGSMEAAERQRQQAGWILAGALDWSRLILRSDGQSSRTDHLGEPWAVQLQETRLSSFLAADKSSAASEDLARQPDAFLSGQIQDAQGRLNFENLVRQGQLVPSALLVFSRLFQQLELPQSELTRLAEQWVRAETPPGRQATGGASEPEPGAQPLPLAPARLQDLQRLGLSASTLTRLEPHVTLILAPKQAALTLNLNTASAEAMAALLALPLADALKLVRARNQQAFTDLAAAERAAGVAPGRFKSELAGVASQYFLVRGRLRLGDMAVQELSLLKREGRGVLIVWRESGVFQDTPAPAR